MINNYRDSKLILSEQVIDEDTIRLQTCFQYPNGEYIDVFVLNRDGETVLTDLFQTTDLYAFSEFGQNMRIEMILKRNGVKDGNDGYEVKCDTDGKTDKLALLILTCSYIATLYSEAD